MCMNEVESISGGMEDHYVMYVYGFIIYHYMQACACLVNILV